VTRSTTTVTPPKEKDGYALNMVSLVIIVEFGNVQFLATGDATGLTMAKCNEVLAVSGPLTKTFMATLPHHGSDSSATDLLGITVGGRTKESVAEQNVAEFVTRVGAQTVTASADFSNGHSLPAASLIKRFWPALDGTDYYSDPVLAPAKRHFYTAYFDLNTWNVEPKNDGTVERWPPSYNNFTVQTSANIFTTGYFVLTRQNSGDGRDWCAVLPPSDPAAKVAPTVARDDSRRPPVPGLGVSWKFSVTGGGAKTVEPIVNRDHPLFARVPAEMLAAQAPPLPAPSPLPEAGVAAAGRRTGPLSQPALASRARPQGAPPTSIVPGLRRLALLS
jgi:hypothetical protein